MYELFPQNVRLLSTERYIDGGKSLGDFENFNLALHVNDSIEAITSNRLLLNSCFNLPSNPKWINQTHSSTCIDAASR